MIWGRTTEEKKAAKRKLHLSRIKFIWFPDQMEDGRWIWWEWVRCEYDEWMECWELKEVVERSSRPGCAGWVRK